MIHPEDEYIQEHCGKYFVAKWYEGAAQYQGPLREEIKKLSGCTGFSCRALDGLFGAGGYVYKSIGAARRRVRIEYEDVITEEI